MPFDHITVRNLNPPGTPDINAELQWLGTVLGLFGNRDKDSSCYRVFMTVVRTAPNGMISSDEIAANCELSRGTVVHHLNKLRDAGMISANEEGYSLTGGSLRGALGELEAELDRLFELSRVIAEDIDRKLRL